MGFGGLAWAAKQQHTPKQSANPCLACTAIRATHQVGGVAHAVLVVHSGVGAGHCELHLQLAQAICGGDGSRDAYREERWAERADGRVASKQAAVRWWRTPLQQLFWDSRAVRKASQAASPLSPGLPSDAISDLSDSRLQRCSSGAAEL